MVRVNQTLISFFRLIATLLDQRLQSLVSKAGGPDAMLHFGRKTPHLKGELFFGNNGYKFELEPTNDNRMMFSREALWWNVNGDNGVLVILSRGRKNITQG